jgi:hypothetical protein
MYGSKIIDQANALCNYKDSGKPTFTFGKIKASNSLVVKKQPKSNVYKMRLKLNSKLVRPESKVHTE